MKNIPSAGTNITIRLVSVDFIPSWKDAGGTVHTVLGQNYINASELPKELQVKLIDICREAWIDHLKTTNQGKV